MRIFGALVFTFAVLVGSIACSGGIGVILPGPGEVVIGRDLDPGILWYKDPRVKDSPLTEAKGKYWFLEKDGERIGFGYVNNPMWAMRNENGEPFIIGKDKKRKYIEEDQLGTYGIGRTMPVPFEHRFSYARGEVGPTRFYGYP